MWFVDEIGSITNVFNTIDIMIVLIMAMILSFIAAKVYQVTHDGISYSSAFVHTLVMFGILVSMVMLIIGSNIARAFTLVGALSIVRFRNAIKETKDVAFIFFVMVIGMAVGTRFYVLAVMMTLFVCTLLVIMHKTNYGNLSKKDYLLKIIGLDVQDKTREIFNKYFEHYELLNIETTSDDLKEFVFLVRTKKWDDGKTKQIMDELKAIDFNKVNFLGTDHLVY